MAQIEYTPYVNQTPTFQIQQPNFEVDLPKITKKKKQDEIVIAPLPESKPEEKKVEASIIDWNDSSKQGKGRSARNYLMSRLGLSDYQASAIVGSFMRESGLNINAENRAEKLGKNSSVNPSQYGIGIGQWTHNRHDDFVRWTSTHGNSLQSQLDFAADEIERKYPEYLAALRQSSNPDEASDLTYVMYTGGNYRDVSGDRLAKAVAERDRAYGAKHIQLYGKDSNNHSARRRQATLEALTYKLGGIVKMQNAGILKSPKSTTSLVERVPSPYQREYNLSDPPRVDNGFDKWYQYVSTTLGLDPNPDAPEHHYDYRGYYDDLVKQGKQYEVIAPGFHFPDTYKLPGHETFSTESKYYKPGMDAGHWEGDRYIGPKTIADLAKFTGSFETFNPNVYVLNTSDGVPQTLAGYGSANPEMIKLANEGKLTEEIARKEMEKHLQKEYDDWMKQVPNFKNLSRGVQLALVDTSYNGKGVTNTIKDSPNLMKMINSGITDPRELVKQMDHSKSAKGWLGVRSAARRAMALGEYDWDWKTVDRFGRQVDYTKYRGPEDWKASPYYNNY